MVQQITRVVIAFCLFTLTIFFFVFYYSCSDYSCFGRNKEQIAFRYNFNIQDLDKTRNINLEGEDVIVNLHIQKTGGASFGRNLVHNLDVDPPCECVPHVKRCECLTKNKRVWLFSRHSTGWMCGVHADWTELSDCVDTWFDNNDVKSRKSRRFVFKDTKEIVNMVFLDNFLDYNSLKESFLCSDWKI